MKRHLIPLCLLLGLVFSLSSCRTAAPRLNYKELAKASILLKTDIDLKDNHKLYIEASKWIGTPYRSGGNTRKGVDCSGLVRQLYQSVYRQKVPRTTQALKDESRKVSKRNLREGDLVFFTSSRSRKKVAHVGIYLKEGKFIHASTSRGVIVSRLSEDYYTRHWMHGGRIR